MAILTYQQQTLIKAISSNNKDIFATINNETENYDIRKLIGVKFLQDIQTNKTDYSDLLIGVSFEDSDGETLIHRGLNFVIAYFNYSRYVGVSDVSDTFTGMVTKNRAESQSLSEGRIKRIQEESRSIALEEWELIKKYLDINYADYPLWNSTLTKKPFRPKIFGVKKTSYGS